MNTIIMDKLRWTALLVGLCATSVLAATTERVSVASDGSQSNNHSTSKPSISDGGRYVAFNTAASNLVIGDTNGVNDIFVHDRDTGITERVSVASDDTESDNSSFTPDISGNGRYVTFTSWASNLVADDSNGSQDVFVHDRDTGITDLVSVASGGSESDNASYSSVISGDGRYVAFYSMATNLVADDTNGVSDIFVHDRDSGITERVSVASGGIESNGSSSFPAISGNGRYVTFTSSATNLVAGDTNGLNDIFVYDRDTGITERVSVASAGIEANRASSGASISGDGRYVAFNSDATNLVADNNTIGAYDVYVHDRNTGITERVSVASDGTQGNNTSYDSTISGNGRYVTFASWASNLIADDSNGSQDVFVHDRDTGITQRVHVASDGAQSNWGVNLHSAISADGLHVAFNSDATNLVANDTNGFYDIFVHSHTYEGFVSGKGWIDSPLGAYKSDPALTGRATFNFMAKYHKEKTVPNGKTKFQFKSGDLNFQSTLYQRLQVSGQQAQLMGEGQINGSGEYGVLLTANDGALNDGSGSDKFRIKIWDKTTEIVVYDSQLAPLGGGGIVIHGNKKGK